MADLGAAFWSVQALVNGFTSRELSPVEATEQLLARIAAFDEQLHSSRSRDSSPVGSISPT